MVRLNILSPIHIELSKISAYKIKILFFLAFNVFIEYIYSPTLTVAAAGP